MLKPSAKKVKAFHYAEFDIPQRENSRYPLEKFRKLVAAAAEIPELHVFSAPDCLPDALRLAHTDNYIAAVAKGTLSETAQREMGFPASEALHRRATRIVGASIAALTALDEDDISVVLGGGAHHAFADRGRGYCVFNDVAIAALSAIESGRRTQVAVVDCDVHQGDGTAAILKLYPQIKTLSIHGANNYPFIKQRSDYDIALADGAGDDEYLRAVHELLNVLDTLSELDLAIFIAGADVFKDDSLGRLALSREGIARRDRLVLTYLSARSIPVLLCFGGGYCRPIETTVMINKETLKIAVEVFISERDKSIGQVRS